MHTQDIASQIHISFAILTKDMNGETMVLRTEADLKTGAAPFTIHGAHPVLEKDLAV